MKTIAALTILSLFALAFIPVASIDATEEYTIDMIVGDTFSYRPETNITTDIEYTAIGNAMEYENGFLTFDNQVLEGTATMPGEYTVVVTATHTVTGQTASQIIIFKVETAALGEKMAVLTTYQAEGWPMYVPDTDSSEVIEVPEIDNTSANTEEGTIQIDIQLVCLICMAICLSVVAIRGFKS